MIYADNNATSPLDPAVWEAMRPYFIDSFFNPSSPYTPARRTSLAIDDARAQLADLVNATPSEVAFTSGGTESNAWAIYMVKCQYPDRKKWICSAVEHASVLEALKVLRDLEGHEVVLIPVDRAGRLDLERFEQALTPDTALVSVMLANNETGILHPVEEIARRAHMMGVPVHTDASQAIGRIPVSFRRLGVDLMTCCAHKMHGPKGIGALVIRSDFPCFAMIRGGDQEHGRRAGTENVPAIVGFGEAAKQAMAFAQRSTSDLRDRVEETVRAHMPDAVIIGDRLPRLPNTTLCLIPGIHTEALIAALDMEGICVSSGSACASGSSEPSHVLRAMGWDPGDSMAVVRISWGRFNTESEAQGLAEHLVEVARRLRRD